MVEDLIKCLPLIIYLLLIVLIVVAIIVGVKLIIAMNKANRILDNVNDKVNTLNGFFGVLDYTTGKINGIYEKITTIILTIVDKIKNRKKERVDEDE